MKVYIIFQTFTDLEYHCGMVSEPCASEEAAQKEVDRLTAEDDTYGYFKYSYQEFTVIE